MKLASSDSASDFATLYNRQQTDDMNDGRLSWQSIHVIKAHKQPHMPYELSN